jgi:hypothetical protein
VKLCEDCGERPIRAVQAKRCWTCQAEKQKAWTRDARRRRRQECGVAHADSMRRVRERRRAALEGREVPEWAQLRKCGPQ